MVAALRLGIRQPPSADRAVQPHVDQHLRTLRVFAAPAQRAWRRLILLLDFSDWHAAVGGGRAASFGSGLSQPQPLPAGLSLPRARLQLRVGMVHVRALPAHALSFGGARNAEPESSIEQSRDCHRPLDWLQRDHDFSRGRFGTGYFRPADYRMDAGQAGARRTPGGRGTTAKEEKGNANARPRTGQAGAAPGRR